jgi:hypothetical protein
MIIMENIDENEIGGVIGIVYRILLASRNTDENKENEENKEN